MGYKVVIEGDAVNVVEKKTGTREECIVLTLDNEESARKMSRQLNLGHGFDGWTPDFFNLKYERA
jgi:hypothetical protein